MPPLRFALPLLALLAAASAEARPLGQREGAALGKALKGYLGAIGRGDADIIVEALPPRVLNVFSGATGIEMKTLKATLSEQTATVLKGTTFREVAADDVALEAEDATLADGSTITWVLIPTSFVSETGGRAQRNEQPLLAISEKGKWHFLRIDGKERSDLAAAAYPFLMDQKIPEASVSPVE